MKCILSLVIDKNCSIFLPLEPLQDIESIDEFTSKNFNDSDEIRKYYQTQIDDFLRKNSNHINQIKDNIGRNSRGYIVLLEPYEVTNNGRVEYLRKKVLYKKHIAIISEMIKYQSVMKQFIKEDKILANEQGIARLLYSIYHKSHSSNEIYRRICFNNYHKASNIQKISKWLKCNNDNYYRKIRLLVQAYEHVREKQIKEKRSTILPTFDSLYKKTLDSKKAKKKDNLEINEVKKTQVSEEDMAYIIDGVRYFADDIPFDNDQLTSMNTTFRPDGLGPKL